MTTFPPLIPSGVRTFTPGDRPHTAHRAMGGGASLVLHTDGIIGQRLRLSFQGLTEAEMRQIRQHYINRRGRFYGFSLPEQLWYGSTSEQTPAGYQWFYVEKPQVTDTACGIYEVQVELEMLPLEQPAVVIPAAIITVAGVAPTVLADLILEPAATSVTISGVPPQVVTA